MEQFGDIHEDSDYEWKPPSEAEMKIIRARRERDNKISQRMGDYLLKGYKMLGTVCTCGTILLQDKQGSNYCIACSELDSDADKDNPVRNQAAALSQVREQQLSSERLVGEESVEQSAPPSGPGATPATHPTPTTHSHDSVTSTVPSTLRLTSGMQAVISPVVPESVDILHRKLAWASKELQQTSSVEYSIQLCQLIKHCADAIHSLQCVGT
ncbi:protein ZNRD2-like [Haliotis cracherodii]|uniref:protein ZNRD2-like n=1 Tax=Haliotis cracherodii TaxID=6455 RepID=UPI0039E90FD8